MKSNSAITQSFELPVPGVKTKSSIPSTPIFSRSQNTQTKSTDLESGSSMFQMKSVETAQNENEKDFSIVHRRKSIKYQNSSADVAQIALSDPSNLMKMKKSDMNLIQYGKPSTSGADKKSTARSKRKKKTTNFPIKFFYENMSHLKSLKSQTFMKSGSQIFSKSNLNLSELNSVSRSNINLPKSANASSTNLAKYVTTPNFNQDNSLKKHQLNDSNNNNGIVIIDVEKDNFSKSRTMTDMSVYSVESK